MSEPIRAVPVRHYGRLVFLVALVAFLALAVWAFAGADIDYSVTLHFLTADTVLSGLGNTIVISVLAQALGIALGVVFAILGRSRYAEIRAFSAGYVWLFRGTPVIVQLLLWYNLSLVIDTVTLPGLGSWQTNELITPFVAALLGLGINEGAYMAEIVRAGIDSVDKGQTEAAQALGMSRLLTLRRVVLPQAMRVIVPPTGNEFVGMLKTSSLAYAIQYGELLQSAVKIYSNNLMIVELLLTVSIWYVVLTTVATVLQRFLERRYSKGVQR
ncbi:amino acid ABC transporter permease [Streptomyces himalayensis]|uniref:Amino acid ABC transporter permease n=2 Tax=Streptomyces himalayensis TaxID=2820085 RepID=A0A7W2CWV5_9ACTN|nr:amino acid ABC transporter permease [Streptomyces himalayensis]MBA2950395.1 amino acid ABC transporter permease [Streptomyces himalayensis subsp. himalayensis]MBA4860544.1 amino acid ABC transporter permease [Streptomyces himalayensis subsp. aureolus]